MIFKKVSWFALPNSIPRKSFPAEHSTEDTSPSYHPASLPLAPPLE